MFKVEIKTNLNIFLSNACETNRWDIRQYIKTGMLACVMMSVYLGGA